jgi:hypothetical protein
MTEAECLACADPMAMFSITLGGRGIIADQTWQLDVPGGKCVRREFTMLVPEIINKERRVFIARYNSSGRATGSDTFIALDPDDRRERE